MKQDADKYLFNEAVKYLGKYPATKKKIEEHLHKKVMNKKTYQRAVFLDDVSKKYLISGIFYKLDEFIIINEYHYLESLFHSYVKSLFSFSKIKNILNMVTI